MWHLPQDSARAYALSLVVMLLLTPCMAIASPAGVPPGRSYSADGLAQKRRVRRRAPRRVKSSKTGLTKSGPQESFREETLTKDRRLDGTFIQFWGNRVRHQWQKVLTAMYDAGMKTIIIQYLKNRVIKHDASAGIPGGDERCPVMDEVTFTYTDSYKMPNGDEIIDPTEFILSFADDRGIDVYVGLINDERFVADQQWNNPRCLDLPRQIEDNQRFADEVWRRYSKKAGTARPHTSFKGWYLPQEMWNQEYTEEQLRDFRGFFAAVSKRCKELSGGLPVAVSPFFNPDLLDAGAFAETYGRFLKSGADTAGIDIVMLQDSVGAKSITYDDIPMVVGDYDRALRAKLDELGIRFWANVESYQEPPRRPADFNRLERQIEIAGGNVTDGEKIVTFDFYHYMNPFGYDHAGDASYVEAEKSLYCAYLKRYAPNTTPPQGIRCSQ